VNVVKVTNYTNDLLTLEICQPPSFIRHVHRVTAVQHFEPDR